MYQESEQFQTKRLLLKLTAVIVGIGMVTLASCQMNRDYQKALLLTNKISPAGVACVYDANTQTLCALQTK